MDGEVLRDDQWERLKPFVPGGRKGRRGSRSDGRLFFDALLWLARSGARWRDLPEKFGPPGRAKRRYYRWVEQGVFDRLLEAVADDPDFEWRMLDATIIRAQAQAAGVRRKKGDLKPRLSAGPEGAGRSRLRRRQPAGPHWSTGRRGRHPAPAAQETPAAHQPHRLQATLGIESFFGKLKQWRRIATRYDKLAANFLGFVKLAAIMMWLK